MNRIFISYRSSDGKKEAGRLCADLSRLYGADQVFFDKQDLRGGGSWREAILATLGTRPVVLLLMTPELLGMAHPEGGRRIDHEDDPIRGELLAAHAHGALIIPLLTEGMTAPSLAELPAALRFLKEPHSLKLRTEDWAHDLAKLVADLRTHGIKPRQDQERLRRVLKWFGGVVSALVLIGLLVEQTNLPDAGPPPSTTLPPAPWVAALPPLERATTATTASAPADVSGLWWSVDEDNRRLRVQLAVNGHTVQLQTDPFPVHWYPEWQAYAEGMRQQGLVLHEVRLVGSGALTLGGARARIDMPYQAFSGDGQGPLDSGSVTLHTSASGDELTGELWSNGEQDSTPLRLVRQP